ncbi:MAG: bifunctional DNA-formamidopyrimidine glycosylase/DNA-(apurinic or apyrimidinic site) lyase [Gammaproteobacteria bacterium]|jgi:formamidopyrimidine-DNA glycosylase
MPELPEVETTRRGIKPWLEGTAVSGVEVRQRQLRWVVPRRLDRQLPGQKVHGVGRRAKYLLLATAGGTLIIHLGMSGSLRVLKDPPAPGPHDHVDIILSSGRLLRFNDPRRFGAMLWTTRDPLRHPLLRDLGPEPLSGEFSGAALYAAARGRRVAIKNLIMNAKVVVGVGNIYASEALFRAGIRPSRPAGRISLARMEKLASSIQAVLGDALEAGGTTLRDFTWGDGQPGYFAQQLRVYERAGQPCPVCEAPLKRIVLGQRSTYYCSACQR